ncbi:GTP pyrophosphokinase family protein, partial [Clostridium botulinum]
KLMMEIKDEIKDAQKLFEVKSSLVSYIMDNILTLQSMGKIIDSNRYQEQLNKLIEEGEVFELNSLLKSTEKTIEMYK